MSEGEGSTTSSRASSALRARKRALSVGVGGLGGGRNGLAWAERGVGGLAGRGCEVWVDLMGVGGVKARSGEVLLPEPKERVEGGWMNGSSSD